MTQQKLLAAGCWLRMRQQQNICTRSKALISEGWGSRGRGETDLSSKPKEVAIFYNILHGKPNLKKLFSKKYFFGDSDKIRIFGTSQTK